MFCTNCGHNLSDSSGNFCAKCGASKSESTTGTASSNVSIQSSISPSQNLAVKLSGGKVKLYAIFAALAVVIIAILYFTGVIGGHEIQGSWSTFDREHFNSTITFTRNRFTTRQFSGFNDWGALIAPEPPWRSASSASGPDSSANFVPVFSSRYWRNQRDQDGRFMDIRFAEAGIWRIYQSGRWYISDNTLELVFDCGHFTRINFDLRRDNTLVLGGMHFRR